MAEKTHNGQRPARRPSRAGPAYVRQEGPNPTRAGSCFYQGVPHARHAPVKARINDDQSPLADLHRKGRLGGEGWRMASWNVGSLTGKSGEVAEELGKRKVDVCGVQETRWKGEGARFLGAVGCRYKLWWKGGVDGTGGVGVMVREELADQVLEVWRRSERVIVVTMLIGKVLTRVISGYAPQQVRGECEKDKFYDELSDEIGKAGDSEFVVVLGDLNGHVGEQVDGCEGVHGGFGYGQSNLEGCRVLELCDAYGLMVGNTLFKREKEKLITYRSGAERGR